jgi:hypothetical protein
VPHEGTSDQGATNRQATNVIYRDQQHISPTETILGHSSIRYWSLCEEKVQRLALLHSGSSNIDHFERSGNLYFWKPYPYASRHANLSTLKNAERVKTWGTSGKERNVEHVPGSQISSQSWNTFHACHHQSVGDPRCATPPIGQQG